MRVETYNPDTMAVISSDVTSVDFGTVARGNHVSQVVALRPVTVPETFTQLALYLEDNAGLDHTAFTSFKSATPVLGILPGDSELSDPLYPAHGASDFVPSDLGINFDPVAPEYVWLDAEVGTAETNLGDATINLRFVFEYA